MHAGPLPPQAWSSPLMYCLLYRLACLPACSTRAKKYFLVLMVGGMAAMPQAKGLDGVLKGLPHGYLLIVNLLADDEDLVTRVQKRAICAKCNNGQIDHIKYNKICSTCNGDEVAREDDKEDIVRNRLVVYHTQTEPVIQYYKDNKGFFEVKAVTIPQTFNEVVRGIESNIMVTGK